MSRLAGKTALVTGGNIGIGRAIVREFVRLGADVAFTFRTHESEAEALLHELAGSGRLVKAVRADLGDEGDVANLVDRATQAVGPLNVLVNNAGTTTRTAFLDIAPDELGAVFNVNFVAPFRLIQRFSRLLIDREMPGSIINISSLSARRAVSKIAHYQCSKAALDMLTKSAAYELAAKGIRVNTVAPGLTASDGNAWQRRDNPQLWSERVAHVPMGRAGRPEDHVGAVAYLASDESSWVTGTILTIDGGQSTR